MDFSETLILSALWKNFLNSVNNDSLRLSVVWRIAWVKKTDEMIVMILIFVSFLASILAKGSATIFLASASILVTSWNSNKTNWMVRHSRYHRIQEELETEILFSDEVRHDVDIEVHFFTSEVFQDGDTHVSCNHLLDEGVCCPVLEF